MHGASDVRQMPAHPALCRQVSALGRCLTHCEEAEVRRLKRPHPEPPRGAAVCPLVGRRCKAGSRGAAVRPCCARVDRAERPSLAEQAVLPLPGYDFMDSERLDG